MINKDIKTSFDSPNFLKLYLETREKIFGRNLSTI